MVPPVPIPNTVVKHSYAESTCLETDWEDRALPVNVKASVRRKSFLLQNLCESSPYSAESRSFHVGAAKNQQIFSLACAILALVLFLIFFQEGDYL